MNIFVQIGGLVLASLLVFQQTIITNLNSGEVLGTISEIRSNLKESNLLIYIGKDQPLPKGFAPNDLVNLKPIGYPSLFISQQAYSSLSKLIKDSEEQGLNLKILSTYRSFQTQEILFNYYANQYTVEVANTFSAKPGYSEHQLSTTVDFGTGQSTDFTDLFAAEPEGIWLKENAYKYGFILSYPQDKVKETGYKFEPWHFRYVGEEVAMIINQNQWTLKEYQIHWLDNAINQIKNSAWGLGVSGFLQ